MKLHIFSSSKLYDLKHWYLAWSLFTKIQASIQGSVAFCLVWLFFDMATRTKSSSPCLNVFNQNCTNYWFSFSGEGIHHAMEGGKLAAKFLDEVISNGNYDKEVMAIYHQRWMDQFGFDFKWYKPPCAWSIKNLHSILILWIKATKK